MKKILAIGFMFLNLLILETVWKDETAFGMDVQSVATVGTEGLVIENNTVMDYNGSATQVVIPKGVTSIGKDAFSECGSVTSITIPESVTSIGEYAFYGCSSLTSIAIPVGVTSIGESTFRGCNSMTSITIPEGISNIGEYAFFACYNMTSITIPEGVTSIGESAFAECNSLTSITIPESVTSIGESAFAGCNSMTSITIPEGVTNIEKYTFDGCSSMTSITIPKGVTSIGDNAFAVCNSLTSITIPEGVKSIGKGAFRGCNSITSITIPEGVKSIGKGAFQGCSSMTSITIPESVTIIGESVFEGCSSMMNIALPNSVISIEKYAFGSCKSLTSITIPEGVTSIGKDAFNRCSSLISIIVPDSVTSIGEHAFDSNAVILSESASVKNYAEKNRYTYNSLSSWTQVVPNFCTSTELGETTMTLKWNKLLPAQDYEIWVYDNKVNTFVLEITTKDTSYKCIGLLSGTVYKYRIRGYFTYNGTKYYSEYQNLVVRTLDNSDVISRKNDLVAKGAVASVELKTKKLKGTNLQFDTSSYFDRWAETPEIIQLKDNKGNLNIAYNDDSYLYIDKFNINQSIIRTLKLKMKYPKLGTVVCDHSGNYYVIWGKEDTAGNGGVVTAAISKYSNSGSFIATTSYKTKTGDENSGETCVPFDAGNCDAVISNNVLVCSYARQMYSGHQSNEVIAVYIDTMKKCDKYGSYTSHSFDQRVISDSYGTIWFADHGDGYERGFNISHDFQNFRAVPFHFYAKASDIDNMWVLNQTNAQLGGIVSTSTGVILVGASVKGMTAATYDRQTKNLFITYADSSLKMPEGTSRKGVCLGKTTTDTGIKWLTNYTKYSVNNPQVVSLNDDRIVVLWEKYNIVEGGEFVQSYYMILSSNGKVLQSATPMNHIRLNSNEEPLYCNGKICWVSAVDNVAKIYSLDISKVKKD